MLSWYWPSGRSHQISSPHTSSLPPNLGVGSTYLGCSGIEVIGQVRAGAPVLRHAAILPSAPGAQPGRPLDTESNRCARLCAARLEGSQPGTSTRRPLCRRHHPRPLFVTEIIPRVIEVLQQHQQRIEQTVNAGGYIDGREHTHVLDLCKQILDAPQA